MSAKRSASRVSEPGTQQQQQKRAQWSNQAYTVDEVLAQFSLPQIVKCNPQAIMVKKDSPLPVNLGQPLLLFDSRTVRKLLARNVICDPVTGKFTENDDTVVIPNDYEGSIFELIKIYFRVTKFTPVRKFLLKKFMQRLHAINCTSVSVLMLDLI